MDTSSAPSKYDDIFIKLSLHQNYFVFNFLTFTIFIGANIAADEQKALADAIALIASASSAKPANADHEKSVESDGGGTDKGRKRRRAASSSSSSDEDQRDSKKAGKKGRGGNCKFCLYPPYFLPF
jgi:hypothetical protein